MTIDSWGWKDEESSSFSEERHRVRSRSLRVKRMQHPPAKRTVLHVCTRETIRPLRDHILRARGFEVDSALSHEQGLSMFWGRDYDLVLIDVEGENGVGSAERLCSGIKSAQPEQLVAFVCNWRVAGLTDCPDDIVRTEFDPGAFADGVSAIVPQSLI